MRAVGYVRVSKADRRRRGESDDDRAAAQKHSLDAQREQITRAAAYERWDLDTIHEDNGKTGAHTRREAFQAALAGMRRGDMLVVAKFDRLSRDLGDYSAILKRAERERWFISILDQKIDTSTAAGWLSATMLAVVADYERRIIAERTREALAVLKAQGVPLGHPSDLPADVMRRIRKRHKAGLSAAAIARELQEAGVPTPRGGTWHHGVVLNALRAAKAVAA